ncbi:MAG: hypothetical protein II968_04340 [Selenomonadaceae bacterium]|nr:hypothetical protein [Selenomonadaceae bacterium]MBQ6758282.1 hypothetical protein [Selenomonadaceae bacterium]MBR6711411.1 hypothetical protein [Selenomonadaceae bacterium]
MTEQEIINQALQRQIDAQTARIDNVLAKVDMLVGEMRDRDNQRAQDIREIRTSISNMQNNIDGMGKHVRNLTVAAMVGMGSMTIAGIAVAISIFLK